MSHLLRLVAAARRAGPQGGDLVPSMSHLRWAVAVLVAVVALISAGCSGSGLSVSGTVTYRERVVLTPARG